MHGDLMALGLEHNPYERGQQGANVKILASKMANVVRHHHGLGGDKSLSVDRVKGYYEKVKEAIASGEMKKRLLEETPVTGSGGEASAAYTACDELVKSGAEFAVGIQMANPIVDPNAGAAWQADESQGTALAAGGRTAGGSAAGAVTPRKGGGGKGAVTPSGSQQMMSAMTNNMTISSEASKKRAAAQTTMADAELLRVQNETGQHEREHELKLNAARAKEERDKQDRAIAAEERKHVREVEKEERLHKRKREEEESKSKAANESTSLKLQKGMVDTLEKMSAKDPRAQFRKVLKDLQEDLDEGHIDQATFDKGKAGATALYMEGISPPK